MSYPLIAVPHALPETKRRHLAKGCWLAINPLSSVNTAEFLNDIAACLGFAMMIQSDV